MLADQNMEEAASGSSEDLWGRAFNKLDVADTSLENLGNGNGQDMLQQLLSLVMKTEQTCQEKKWKWKNRGGQVVIFRDIFVKMTVWIQKFKAVGDVLVQYDPGHATLPWALARFILQATVSDVEKNAAMIEALEFVFSLIAKFAIVERIYVGGKDTTVESLTHKIVDLYKTVLEFLLKAYRYFRQSSISRIAKNIFTVEERAIANIRAKSSEIDSYLDLVTGETISRIGIKIEDTADDLQRERHDLKQLLIGLDEPINRIATQLSSINDSLNEETRLKIFEWLSSVRYISHHRTKAKALLPRSGQWLFRKPEFVDWHGSSSSSILWLHGMPGSGKSMLVARVIEYLKERSSNEPNPAPIAFFYCARGANEPERSDPTEVLRTLLEQLSSSDLSLPIRLPVVRAYLEKRNQARGRQPEKLELEEAVELILEIAEEIPATIFIDGLDECTPALRQDLLDSLQTILRKANNVIKIFVSSRDDHDLVHRLSRVPNTYIHATDNSDDIRDFVRSRVSEAIKAEKLICGAVSSELQTTIVDTLINKAAGMFRLPSLHIDRLCDPRQVKTEANVLSALSKLPLDLKSSYDTIMEQIASSEEPNSMLAGRIMKWLLCSQQALNSNGFTFAVCEGLRDCPILKVSDVVRICCNLVSYDEELDEFRFVHLTVQEYLSGLKGYSRPDANAFAAEQCLSWIMSPDSLCAENPRTQSFGQIELGKVMFDEHASTFWAQYTVEAAKLRQDAPLKSLLRQFLLPMPLPFQKGCAFSNQSPYVNQMYEKWTTRMIDVYGLGSPAHPYGFVSPVNPRFGQCWGNSANPLFTVCAFNLSELVPDLLLDHTAFAAKNSSGHNCAQIAVTMGNQETLRAIFDLRHALGVDDGYWPSLLSYALSISWEGRKDFLNMTLDVFGPGSVTQDTFLELIKVGRDGQFWRRRNFLPTIFENSKDLSVTTDLLELAMEDSCKTGSLRLLHNLLKFATNIKVTVSLISTARRLGEDAHPAMNAIMDARNKQNPDSPSPDGPSMGTQKDEITTMLMLQGPGALELTWQDVVHAKKLEGGRESIEIVLKTQPKVKQSAVTMLISLWDPSLVRELLEFQQIEITPDIIKAAAGNLEWGAAIMGLLLEKELEGYD